MTIIYQNKTTNIEKNSRTSGNIFIAHEYSDDIVNFVKISDAVAVLVNSQIVGADSGCWSQEKGHRRW